MLTNLELLKQTSGQEPNKIQRRALIGGALAALLATPSRPLRAESATDAPTDPFILLLQGIYQDVKIGQGPNLGLTSVNLNDGSWSVTQIYAVYGVPGIHGEGANEDKTVGNFYVQFFHGGALCAYQLPGGALAMRFAPGQNFTSVVPDGSGGAYLEGGFELTIIEANGVYTPFQGGSNHMVDKLHKLANGQYDEHCFCNIAMFVA
jgi:hypothetical protein